MIELENAQVHQATIDARVLPQVRRHPLPSSLPSRPSPHSHLGEPLASIRLVELSKALTTPVIQAIGLELVAREGVTWLDLEAAAALLGHRVTLSAIGNSFRRR